MIRSPKSAEKYSIAYMKEIIQEDKRFLKIYSQTRQDIRDRLIQGIPKLLQESAEKKEREKIRVGFPRFSSRDRYKSFDISAGQRLILI